MIEISIDKFSELTGFTRQAISKKMREGKINYKKDEETGRVSILLDIHNEELENTKLLKDIRDLLQILVDKA